MRHPLNKKLACVLLAAAGLLVIGKTVYSHCQIPCGIYDDPARFKMTAEDITTIEKSMKSINELSADPGKNFNQLVRWVDNKDAHADKIAETVTAYFMAQRLKPVEDPKSPEYSRYVEQLTLLHQMLVTSMKCKQTTDLEQPHELSHLLQKFQTAYEKK